MMLIINAKSKKYLFLGRVMLDYKLLLFLSKKYISLCCNKVFHVGRRCDNPTVPDFGYDEILI